MEVKWRIGKVDIYERMVDMVPGMPPVEKRFSSMEPYYQKYTSADILFDTAEDAEQYIIRTLRREKEETCDLGIIRSMVDLPNEEFAEEFALADEFGDWGELDAGNAFF